MLILLTRKCSQNRHSQPPMFRIYSKTIGKGKLQIAANKNMIHSDKNRLNLFTSKLPTLPIFKGL